MTLQGEGGGLLDPVQQAVNAWGTQGGGGLWAAGVGGAITGRLSHLLIIDDPVKNRGNPRMMDKLWTVSSTSTQDLSQRLARLS